MDPSLVLPDARSPGSGSSRWHGEHGHDSTYHGSLFPLFPLSVGTSITPAASHRISLHLLQARAKMHSPESPRTESSCSSTYRASSPPVRRSVTVMKSLLPLRLVSQTLPEWPSSAPCYRTTFGTTSDDLDGKPKNGSQNKSRPDFRLSGIPSRQSYRDMPIYTEPGSPLPSPAYFSDQEIYFDCPPESSSNDDACIVHAYGGDSEDDMEDITSQIESIPEETTHNADDTPRRSYVEATPRWSELSFQCSGEGLSSDESELHNPLEQSQGLQLTATSINIADSQPAGCSVETWLKDTSGYENEDDVLACATVLAPAKAQVVDLSSRASTLTVRIPPRISSLFSAFPTPIWSDDCRVKSACYVDSPPITPSGHPLHDINNTVKEPQANREVRAVLPTRRLDLAMTSPPQSPKGHPKRFSAAKTPSPRKRLPYKEMFPFSSKHVSATIQKSIVRELETTTNSFPSKMLSLEHPCASTIRAQTQRTQTSNPKPLLSPFAREELGPVRWDSVSSCTSINFSRHRRQRSSSEGNINAINTAPSAPAVPDLEPLRQVFPHSSDYLHSALYAHVLAYTYTKSITTSQQASPPRKKPDAPRWNPTPVSPRSGDPMNMSSNDRDSGVFSIDYDIDLEFRIQSLEEKLHKCIRRLISVMDSNGSPDKMIQMDDNDNGIDNGSLLLRALEEIVKSCESKC